MIHDSPVTTEIYRGHEIYLAAPRAVCPYFVAGLRAPCRDLAHGRQIVDTHLAQQAQPRSGGRIVAAEVRVINGWSASARRNQSERSRGAAQRRKAARA